MLVRVVSKIPGPPATLMCLCPGTKTPAATSASTSARLICACSTSIIPMVCQAGSTRPEHTRYGPRGGVHVYFRGARPTTGLFVDGAKVGDIKSTGGYVLAEGSIHPDGPVYTVIDDSGILPLPDISSLVKRDKERVIASADGDPIPQGSHDTELTRIAGVLRNAGFTPAKIEEHLIDVCEQRCTGYGSDYKEMCHKIAHSIGKKPVGQAGPIPVLGSARNAEPNGRTMQFVRGDSIQPKRLKWLWRGRILADKLNVFSGEPDVGKGMTTVDLAARLTRHLDFPDGKNELDGPKDVVFLSSEDDMEDTVVRSL